VASWEVAAPAGCLPEARWWCHVCGVGTDWTHVGSGDRLPSAEDLRTAAVEHVRKTGHRVLFRRGTSEEFTALATEVPDAPR